MCHCPAIDMSLIKIKAKNHAANTDTAAAPLTSAKMFYTVYGFADYGFADLPKKERADANAFTVVIIWRYNDKVIWRAVRSKRRPLAKSLSLHDG